MRIFAIALNIILFLYTLYLISKAGFQNQPRDILLQFLLLIPPAFNLLALFQRRKEGEKWML